MNPPDAEIPAPPEHRRIRSFVRREGRLTHGQRDALDRLAPRFSLDHIGVAIDLDAAFGRAAPTCFEIGFGNGDALMARAMARPEMNHLGVEVHRPGVGRLLSQVEQHGLNNVRVMTRDAVEVLREQIAPDSLLEVIVEFPDPWHKTRHHKRRLIQQDFVRLVCERLARGGVLHLATDWAHYAEQMREVCNAEPGLENLSAHRTFVARPGSRPVTRFEARGERLGHAVFDLAYKRA
ncbi:MAG: tRNA (guanosine(46)-N7)-methyltransferase TrmB [Panacagrimonas sp.]